MNAMRRKQLARAIQMIYDAQEIIEMVKEEEQDSYDNLPEGIQDSERGETMYENIDTLGEISDNLIDMTTELEDM